VAVDKKQGSKSIAKLETATDLNGLLKDLKDSRSKLEKDWRLNLAFYRGNQYCYVSKSGKLETLPVDDGDKPRYRVRMTSNQIRPGVQSLLSKLTKTKPQIHATPASSSVNDVKAAQMSQYLLEDWWVQLGMDDKLEEALLWSIIAGQGWWKITWDQHAGKAMNFTMNPNTEQPITNEDEVTMYKNFLGQMGLPETFSDKTVYLGDVRIDTLSPFHVWIDQTARTWTEAKYAICEHSLSPDEIQARWNVRLEPDSVPSDLTTPIPYANSEGASKPSVRKVYFGYFVPQASLPQGRYVVWVDDKGDNGESKGILEDGPWPYPTNDLPLVKFGGVRVPGSIYDDADVTDGRPLQKAINKIISDVEMYRNLTLKPRVWAPVGSMTTRLTSEGGAVYEFQPVAGMRPEVEKLPAIPPYVFEHLGDITARLRDIFGLTEVSEGALPPNLEAGIAIDLLQEASSDRFAPRIKLLETSLARAGKILLSLAKEYYVEERMLRIRGGGGSLQVKKFKNADIAGGVDVQAESGSGLPRTRAGKQARIEKLMEQGLIQPHQAYRYLDIADLRSVAARFAADEDQAMRQQEKILKQEPLNGAAVQQAMMAVAQGINPETGEPIQDESEIQMILMRASLTPGPADNFPVHLDTHHDWITSVEFEQLPPQIQQAAVMHYSMDQEQARQNAPVPEGQAPRVSMSIHGTAGPTVASEIMKKAGVAVTPEDFQEPPLETLVMDSIDAPDADSAANDPLTTIEQMQSLMQSADQHQLSMAKGSHEVALAAEKVRSEKKKQTAPKGGK
jgi:hypothetical protein